MESLKLLVVKLRENGVLAYNLAIYINNHDKLRNWKNWLLDFS